MQQTISRPMKLSIEIPDALGRQLQALPNRDSFVITAIKHELLGDPLDQCTSLNEVADIISRRAEERGLTEEIFNEIMNEK